MLVKPHSVAADFLISHYNCQRPVDWDRQFQRKAPLDLEVGFGMGEFLIRSARQSPERNFVGIEYDGIRIKKTVRRIARINEQASVQERLPNIRILQIDAQVALERLFRPRSVARMACLFPCPWPKKRHVKHRLFSRDFLRLVNSRLGSRGFLHIVTDHEPYRDWILTQSTGAGFQSESRVIRPGYDTKYERKWVMAGQKKFYELVFRKKRHIKIPLRKDARLKKYYLKEFPHPEFCFQDRTGDPAVIFKKIVFDKTSPSMRLYLVVAEKNLTQHVRIQALPCPQGWEIALDEGQPVLPTPGVARALREVYRQAKKKREFA